MDHSDPVPVLTRHSLLGEPGKCHATIYSLLNHLLYHEMGGRAGGGGGNECSIATLAPAAKRARTTGPDPPMPFVAPPVSAPTQQEPSAAAMPSLKPSWEQILQEASVGLTVAGAATTALHVPSGSALTTVMWEMALQQAMASMAATGAATTTAGHPAMNHEEAGH